jgi:hypothetical protein
VKVKGQKGDSDTGKYKSHPPHPMHWHLYIFSGSIPERIMTLDSKMFSIMPCTAMPLRFLVFHFVVVMVSKK